MLQQTTVAAVIPYYERFLEEFPTLESLARAPIETVLERWAGLGYYSRARNLHQAAQALVENGEFPKTYDKLLTYPGFGDYTARAVASLAFGERVGVVDGNVIRVLSRVYDLDLEWWKPQARKILQERSDALASAAPSIDTSTINQGLMELGATVCTVKNPSCVLCPWVKACLARKNGTIGARPRPKARREMEQWHWQPVVNRKGKRVQLVRNDYAPFLKGHWIWPGAATKLTKAKKPGSFHYRGTVTHHDIYVSISNSPKRPLTRSTAESIWVPIDEIKAYVPSSLVRKALDAPTKS